MFVPIKWPFILCHELSPNIQFLHLTRSQVFPLFLHYLIVRVLLCFVAAAIDEDSVEDYEVDDGDNEVYVHKTTHRKPKSGLKLVGPNHENTLHRNEIVWTET